MSRRKHIQRWVPADMSIWDLDTWHTLFMRLIGIPREYAIIRNGTLVMLARTEDEARETMRTCMSIQGLQVPFTLLPVRHQNILRSNRSSWYKTSFECAYGEKALIELVRWGWLDVESLHGKVRRRPHL